MWQVSGASRTGPQHQDNQDSWGWQALDGGFVAVVADGAGSASRSGEGSRLAVSAALEAVTRSMSRSPAKRAVEAVETARAALDGDRSLASTLTVAVALEDTLAVAAIGDSPAFVMFDDFHVEQWESAKASEFVNETVFLTSPNAAVAVWEAPLARVELVVVASDGLTPCVTTSGVPTAGFFAPLYQRVASSTLDLAELLEFMGSRRLLGDDTTVVAAHRSA